MSCCLNNSLPEPDGRPTVLPDRIETRKICTSQRRVASNGSDAKPYTAACSDYTLDDRASRTKRTGRCVSIGTTVATLTTFTIERSSYEAALLSARSERLPHPRELRERSLERISACIKRSGVHALSALASPRRRQRDNARAFARRAVRSTVTEEVK